MALIGEPHGTGNLADSEIRFGQQSLRPLDPCPQNVLARGDPDSLAELPMEVEATHPGNIRQIIEADGAAEPCIDVRHHASQLVARQAALHRRNSVECAWELHRVPTRSSSAITASSDWQPNQNGICAALGSGPAQISSATIRVENVSSSEAQSDARAERARGSAVTNRPRRSNSMRPVVLRRESIASAYSRSFLRRSSSRSASAKRTPVALASTSGNRCGLKASLGPATDSAPRTLSSTGSRTTLAEQVQL